MKSRLARRNRSEDELFTILHQALRASPKAVGILADRVEIESEEKPPKRNIPLTEVMEMVPVKPMPHLDPFALLRTIWVACDAAGLQPVCIYSSDPRGFLTWAKFERSFCGIPVLRDKLGKLGEGDYLVLLGPSIYAGTAETRLIFHGKAR